jgi:hypothetical protein
MCGGEPFKVGPFLLCLLEKSLEDLFSLLFGVKSSFNKGVFLSLRDGEGKGNVFGCYCYWSGKNYIKGKCTPCVFSFCFFVK